MHLTNDNLQKWVQNSFPIDTRNVPFFRSIVGKMIVGNVLIMSKGSRSGP